MHRSNNITSGEKSTKQETCKTWLAGEIMVYEKRFTEDDVLEYLRQSKEEGRERTLKEIYMALECSEGTAWNVLKRLLETKVQRRNAGTEKKPSWLYSLKRT